MPLRKDIHKVMVLGSGRSLSVRLPSSTMQARRRAAHCARRVWRLFW